MIISLCEKRKEIEFERLLALITPEPWIALSNPPKGTKVRKTIRQFTAGIPHYGTTTRHITLLDHDGDEDIDRSKCAIIYLGAKEKDGDLRPGADDKDWCEVFGLPYEGEHTFVVLTIFDEITDLFIREEVYVYRPLAVSQCEQLEAA